MQRQITPPAVLALAMLLTTCGNSDRAATTSWVDQPIPVAPADAVKQAVPILAHFCNWHRKESGNNSWDLGTTTPLRSDGNGIGYDSLDKNIIREQNTEMAANGITPLISWWGRKGSALEKSGDVFLDTYLSVPSEVKFGILYEVTGLLAPEADGIHYSFDDPENARRFVADIDYLYRNYLSRPEYAERIFRIDGRPVVFIWLSHAFTGNFAAAAKEAKKVAPIYLVGSNFNVFGTTPADTSVIGGLDAVSAYGIYTPPSAIRFSGHVNAEYVKLYTQSVAIWSDWLGRNAPGTSLILPLQFTYHDSRGNPLMTGTTKDEAALSTRTAREIIEKSTLGCRNVLPYALIVSYNEHFEGSSIEPTVEYGTSFLDTLRETFSEPIAAPANDCGNK